MEDNKMFVKNIQTDGPEQFQAEHSYRHANNVIVSDTIGSISMEQGFAQLTPLGSGYWTCIGHTECNSTLILFLANDDASASEIGYVVNGVYTAVIPSSVLNFSTKHQIDCKANTNYKGEIIVYFTDNNSPVKWCNIVTGEIGPVLTQPKPTVTKLFDIQTGGRLYAGSYQFATRYVDLAGVSTDFGFVSEVIPINDDPLGTAPEADFDGAFVDTLCNKKILVDILNIDTRMRYVEIAVIKYVGADSQSVVEVFERIEIRNRDTLRVTYSGVEKVLVTTTIEAVQDISPSYSVAKCLEMKDGRLFISNLKSRKVDVTLLQTIANDVTIHYEIEPGWETQVGGEWQGTPSTPGPNWIRTSPLTSPIPGSLRFSLVTNYHSYNTYKNLINAAKYKTYRRDEVYSFGISYIFDDNSISPVFHIPGSLTPSSDQLSAWLSDIDYPSGNGYPTGKIRHHRMPTLVQSPVVDYTSTVTLQPLKLSFRNLNVEFLKEYGITGVVYHRQLRDSLDNQSIIAQGLVYKTIGNQINLDGSITPGILVADAGGNPQYNEPAYNYWSKTGAAPDPNVFDTVTYDGRDVVALYSPEWMYNTQEQSYAGFGLKAVGKIILNSDYVGTDINSVYNGDENATIYTNYRRYSYQQSTVLAATDETGTAYPIRYSFDVPPYVLTDNMSSTSATRSVTYSNRWFASSGTQGYRILELEANNWIRLPISDLTLTVGKGYHNVNNASYADTSFPPNDYYQGNVVHHIYNIVYDNPSQYGSIEGAVFVPIHVEYEFDPTRNQRFYPVNNVFGGDTFITRFTYENKRLFGFPINVSVNSMLTEVWLESSINCELRHRAIDVNTNSLGIPYWPKYELIYESDVNAGIGLSQIDPYLGHHRSYNSQYSIEDNIKVNISVPFNYSIVEHFPNRTVYSERQLQGMVQDMMTVFLSNNYEDITQATGPIHDTFVHNGTLYLHTTRSLLRTFVNEREAVASSSGAVYLGASGVFAQPAQQIADAGTISQWGGAHTPYGYFFVDAVNKKAYIFTNQLVDISQNGLFNWHNEQFNSVTADDDNPANFTNIVSGYDPYTKRVVTTNHNDKYTLSYSFITNGWASYHDYRLSRYITYMNDLYSVYQTHLWLHNRGYNRYFGESYDSELYFVSNPNPRANNVFDNLILHINAPIKTIQSNTSTQLSEVVDLTYSVPHEHGRNLRILENQWQLAIPRDQFDEGRMRDKWCAIRITIERPFTLNMAKVLFRSNAR